LVKKYINFPAAVARVYKPLAYYYDLRKVREKLLLEKTEKLSAS